MTIGPLSNVLDWALDLTTLGYSWVGYRARDLHWSEAVDGDRMRGRVAVVTGASSGIGEATCEGLAAAGADVVMVVRDRDRGAEARDRIARRLGSAGRPGTLELELCDLADLESVRALAGRLNGRDRGIALLVNNAGVLPSQRERAPGDFELTFATNALGPFTLTELLLPALRRDAPARVVNVSSGGMYLARLDPGDPQLERRSYSGTRFYAHTKRIGVVMTEMWAEREAGSGIEFHAMHPGWVETRGLSEWLPRFRRVMDRLLRDARQGADTTVWLGTTPELPGRSGDFWHDRRVRPTHRLPKTRETAAEREALWGELWRLAGLEGVEGGRR